MIRDERGFTLVELMITMVIFVLAIAAAANMLTGLITQFKQQSKVAESNIQGVVGLEMLRADVEQAGYGLPRAVPDLDGNGVPNETADWQGLVNYNEAANDSATPWDDTVYNDITSTIGRPPRAIVSGEPANGFTTNNTVNTPSDVLVVKSANVSFNATGRKWTYISNTGATNVMRGWGTIADENLNSADRVIVIDPEAASSQGGMNALINNGGVFFTKVQDFPVNGGSAAAFEPFSGSYKSFIVYGISDNVDPRMPFNRADYYIRRPTSGMPQRCEPTTGILYKGTINQSDGNHTELPLLDCVGYMKVVLALDMNDDGMAGTFSNADSSSIAGGEGANATAVQATLTDPALLRQRLKQVRIYIVVQEGQIDYTYQSPATIAMPDSDINVPDFTVPNKNYRWKVYSLVLTPTSLR